MKSSWACSRRSHAPVRLARSRPLKENLLTVEIFTTDIRCVTCIHDLVELNNLPEKSNFQYSYLNIQYSETNIPISEYIHIFALHCIWDKTTTCITCNYNLHDFHNLLEVKGMNACLVWSSYIASCMSCKYVMPLMCSMGCTSCMVCITCMSCRKQLII